MGKCKGRLEESHRGKKLVVISSRYLYILADSGGLKRLWLGWVWSFTLWALCRHLTSVSWDLESIKYLGMNIPKHLNLIMSDNYDPLFSQIKSDLTRWNLVPFQGLGQRVEAIKMNVLPRLLYLFQKIPAELPKEKFQELDKLISRFIWQGKRPRIRYKTLQLAKDKGGLSDY